VPHPDPEPADRAPQDPDEDLCSCTDHPCGLWVDLPGGRRPAVPVDRASAGPTSALLFARCGRCGRRYPGPWRLDRH
jgi:hypothetical protein